MKQQHPAIGRQGKATRKKGERWGRRGSGDLNNKNEWEKYKKYRKSEIYKEKEKVPVVETRTHEKGQQNNNTVTGDTNKGNREREE